MIYRVKWRTKKTKLAEIPVRSRLSNLLETTSTWTMHMSQFWTILIYKLYWCLHTWRIVTKVEFLIILQGLCKLLCLDGWVNHHDSTATSSYSSVHSAATVRFSIVLSLSFISHTNIPSKYVYIKICNLIHSVYIIIFFANKLNVMKCF